jgi:hypothetical protein
MRFWIRSFIGILLVGIALAAARLAPAQTPQPPAPSIISGSDVGFRVDATATRQRGKLAGAWVVRVNGEWVEPESVPAPKHVTMR